MDTSCHSVVVDQHDWESADPFYLSVVSAVAASLGVDPESMDPLGEVFDPVTFEAFVASGRAGTLRVQFEYEGCLVAVDSEGGITVLPPESK